MCCCSSQRENTANLYINYTKEAFFNEKNVIVGQSGGPTAVINASLYGVVYEALMQKEQIGTVYGMINGIEGFLADTIMDMNSVEQSGELELIKTTPGSFLGSCRYKLPEDLKDDVYPLLFKKFEEYSIGYFFLYRRK